MGEVDKKRENMYFKADKITFPYLFLTRLKPAMFSSPDIFGRALALFEVFCRGQNQIGSQSSMP